MTKEPPNATQGIDADHVALMLVSTPIGNLGDLAPRAVEVLRTVDAVLCEDTRHTTNLLSAHGIRVKLIALHDHNEQQRSAGLIASMQRGRRYALVSDAGAPLIADPGFRLVRGTIAAGLKVSGIPGANAAIMALALSGLPPYPFLFYGFLPARPGQRQAELASIAAAEGAGLNATLIFYEAPHRLAATLADAVTIFGDRPAAIARELTKRFEEIRRDTLPNLAAFYFTNEPRGEITLVVGPRPASVEIPDDRLDAALLRALATQRVRDAASTVAVQFGISRARAYQRALRLRGVALEGKLDSGT